MASKRTLWQWFKDTWPDWLNFSVGAWMILSAFVPDFSGPPPGPMASGLSGLAIAAVSFAAVVRVKLWKEWVNLLLGLWLVAVPWVLGLRDFNPFWNFVGDGLFLAGHAAYQIIWPPHRREGF
jgi:hypothetical protein